MAVLTVALARPALAAPSDNDGIIRGRVIEAATGRPLRNARVHVESVALRDGITVRSGANGEFEVTSLAAGNYTVTASKPGYVAGAYGQSRPLAPSFAVMVSGNAVSEHIDVRLVKGGGIAGTITNEFGKPVAHLEVHAMRHQFVQGVKRLVSVGVRSTDDNGAYRIFGLPPGQYYLAVTLGEWSDADVVTPQTYAATYYPGTANLTAAKMLNITANKTVEHLRMQLIPVRAARVSGVVVSSIGLPLHGGLVTASIRDGSGPAAPRDETVTQDGTFSIGGLAPGDYLLRIQDTERESVTVRVAVGTGDISNLRLALRKPAIIRGRIVIDPGERGRATGSSFRLSVPAVRAEESGIAGGAGNPAKDDFTFAVQSRPGRVLLRANGTDWLVRAVRLNGVDVTDTGFEAAAGDSIDGVEVELTRQPGISGSVLAADGTVTRDAYVVVFAADRARWGYQSRFVRMSRPNADSRFRVLLPPGDYLATAVSDLGDGEWSDPAFLERARHRAVAVTLGDREQDTLELKLVKISRP